MSEKFVAIKVHLWYTVLVVFPLYIPKGGDEVKKYIAILGFGVVGGGCADVLEKSRDLIAEHCGFEVEIKYILDLRDFPDSPYADKIVHDYNVILNDPEIELVAEMMGGSHPALEFSLSAMRAGKSVVTSNKEVVATHGITLLECARENGVFYMFEASVGGGIPIIHTIDTSLMQNKIYEICGILNGTTNYILTRMKKEGVSFDSALKEAREKGYAEADPSADIDGIDSCRKIAILAALAFGKLIAPENIYTDGIRNISSIDTANAATAGYAVKLIGRAYSQGEKVCAYVCPMLVSETDPLSTVNDVFNGIKIIGDSVGEVMLYGRGAGKMPTASAVVSDIINILTGSGVTYSWSKAERSSLIKVGRVESRYYFRADKSFELEGVTKISNDSAITDVMNEDEYIELIKRLDGLGIRTLAHMRVL